MVEGFITDGEKLEFRQIVLTHIKRILEISSHELRDTTREIQTEHSTNIIEQEDTRKAYIQAIENLAIILKPYFDKRMEEVFSECSVVINSYGFQLKKMFKEDIEEILKELGRQDVPNDYFIDLKIYYAKQMFIELNLLLKRNDYLKGSVYGEDEEENEIVEVDTKNG